MTALWGHIVGVVTLLLLFVFVAIWIWAWLPRHRRSFDELARMPMLDASKPAPRDESRP